jgi:hypothetical protein
MRIERADATDAQAILDLQKLAYLQYELFTGHRSRKNLHLYDKLGYRPLSTRRLNDRVTLVYLEKASLAP